MNDLEPYKSLSKSSYIVGSYLLMAFFLQKLDGAVIRTVITLMEDPGIRGLDKILRSVVQVNILEEYILKSIRGRMEGVEYETEVVNLCLLELRTPS